MAFFDLDCDISEDDWIDVLGCSFDEYVEPIKQKYLSLPQGSDRNDILRETFNNMAGSIENRNIEGIKNFYSCDLYSRLSAYEMPKENVLTLYGNSYDILNSEEANCKAIREVAEKTDGVFSFFDHGFDKGHFALSVAATYPKSSVIMYDIYSPTRQVIKNAINKYLQGYNVKIIWANEVDIIDCGIFDVVNSQEVLEHIYDPVNEVIKISNIIVKGGLFHMSTFFDSNNGRDPAHLDENKKFQNSELWFQEVEKCGFKRYGYDPRGHLKIFKRI